MKQAAFGVLLLVAGLTTAEVQSLDIIRLLAEKPWLTLSPHHKWDRPPRIEYGPRIADVDDDNGRSSYADDILRVSTDKRSAVATALNSGRRRRQPAPALGKAVTPYVGVGLLNDVGSFFDALRDNLEALASLSPQQRATLFQEPPTVVHAQASGSGGGSGIRKLHALRPLRPTSNIRSYNRRSILEADGGYPGANHHDPGLLWTGLGRR